jgi:hypothetical protein
MKTAMITGTGSSLGHVPHLLSPSAAALSHWWMLTNPSVAETSRLCGSAQVVVQDLTAPGGADDAVERSTLRSADRLFGR